MILFPIRLLLSILAVIIIPPVALALWWLDVEVR